MTPSRTIAALLVAASLLFAAACGGGSEEDKAKSTVEDYLAAVVKGDGDKACSLVTDQTKKNIERGGRKCAETISALNKGPGRQVLKAFDDAKVENVKVTGDRATADIKVKSLTQKTNLRKEDGKWKLDSTGVGA
jgi:phage protein D